MSGLTDKLKDYANLVSRREQAVAQLAAATQQLLDLDAQLAAVDPKDVDAAVVDLKADVAKAVAP